MVTPNEVVREARRCFRRLAEPEAHLRDITPYLSDRRTWGLFVARNGFAKPVMRLEGAYVDAFAERDWIEPCGENRACLSEAGAKWLRRSTSDDPYLSQHQERAERTVETAPGEAIVVAVNSAESPLTWLHARRDASGAPVLSTDQYDAGERLRRDFELAQMRPHVTASWDSGYVTSRRARGAGAKGDISDAALAARQRVHKALKAVGPELASVLVEVCCFLNGLTGAERSLGLPKRSGKVVLQIALSGLARHYGLTGPAPARRPDSRHWGADGYKPAL